MSITLSKEALEELYNNGDIEDLLKIESIKPLFSFRRLAEFFDLQKKNGAPNTQTISQWIREGKIPPPDVRISRSTAYWKHETILNFVRQGGVVF